VGKKKEDKGWNRATPTYTGEGLHFKPLWGGRQRGPPEMTKKKKKQKMKENGGFPREKGPKRTVLGPAGLET